jgi:hypothetical protein
MFPQNYELSVSERACGLMREGAVSNIPELLGVIAEALDRALEERWTKQERVVERTTTIYSVVSSEVMQNAPRLLAQRLRTEIRAWETQDNLDQARARMEQDDWEDSDQ